VCVFFPGIYPFCFSKNERFKKTPSWSTELRGGIVNIFVPTPRIKPSAAVNIGRSTF